RLLRAIFGEKSREVRDTSLRVPHGEIGTVIGVRVFDREDDDELTPGVNQMVRVYVAQRRKITIGDKMPGRHGNKRVISTLLPDATAVDVILNPHRVPRRMNIGQVFEAHLGWISKQGWKIEGNPEWAAELPAAAREAEAGTNLATPVFDGAHEQELRGLLES